LREQNSLQVLGIVQVVRLGRFVRILRLARVAGFLEATKKTFRNYFGRLFFVGLIMVAGVWVCAIFMTQVVGRSRLRHTEFSDGRNASERFGSVPRSIWTLFEIMTLEHWQTTGRPLVEAEPFMALFFVVYIMIFTFGVLNMVVAVIVDYALEQARRMFEVDVDIMQDEVDGDLDVMYEAFKQCDVDDDGTVYRKEFVESVTNTTGPLAECLDQLGIPTQDAVMLFDILDSDVSGGITPEEFLHGCGRVLGASDPKWDALATHACAVGVAKQFQEFRDDVRKATGFNSSTRSASPMIVRSQSSSPGMRGLTGSLRQPMERNVWGHPDSDRKHVQPSKYQKPRLAPWQNDNARQFQMNEQLLTQLNKDLKDEIAHDQAFLERLSNLERKIQPSA